MCPPAVKIAPTTIRGTPNSRSRSMVTDRNAFSTELVLQLLKLVLHRICWARRPAPAANSMKPMMRRTNPLWVKLSGLITHRYWFELLVRRWGLCQMRVSTILF